ncbi:MAG: PilZ domain-containing protein [Phycisphaerales bacterium]|nr:MAG: PilZ domain-containing protein [Phycisphaerales bacterium]UCF15497.1 MAG: PilZ domain-containing protein [Phycisphaerales bacterium]
MNEVMTPGGVDSRRALQAAIDEKIPAIMSYLSKNKWHVAKVLMTDLVEDQLKVESTSSEDRKRPINIRVDQPVGISFKYGYGKFVFDTVVQGLEPSSRPDAHRERGGTVVLSIPDKIEVIQRRSYFRVNVPESLKVQVLLWHRTGSLKEQHSLHDAADEMKDCCRGRLVDISAGGAQVDVPLQDDTPGIDFKKGQFVGMRFTPAPYETPVLLSAQIRNILPTADGESSSLGLQIVGLEASAEGREVLARLTGIVEKYYQMNQSSAKQQPVEPAVSQV